MIIIDWRSNDFKNICANYKKTYSNITYIEKKLENLPKLAKKLVTLFIGFFSKSKKWHDRNKDG